MLRSYARMRNVLNFVVSRGDIVAMPPNALRPKTGTIYAHGEKALEVFFPPNDEQNIRANQAQKHYCMLRPALLASHMGMWIAVDEDGSYIITPSEEFCRSFANQRWKEREYFVECIGCELLMEARMDSSVVGRDTLDNYVIPEGKQSAIVNEELLVRAEYSLGGATKAFLPVTMKFATGATHMGVPKHVLNNPPRGVEMIRGSDFTCLLPHGPPLKVRSYEGCAIRVGHTVISTTIIEASSWLMGYPVWKNFIATVSPGSAEPLTLVPLYPQLP
eukprot:TRINITY_DN9852_c0_g1_i5.p1 TRINITY_DN9852_c0_g1~~TRINITY_DN9852_c0_g1_i5.p1  ORF type:complete len:275 (-),score=27.32 TRINITY_DN9852_c0_g1_i5:840-1664(-)